MSGNLLDILEITVANLQQYKNDYILVDVREPHELLGPEGKIEGVILASMGSNLAHFLASADPDQAYVFICRSGHRSAQACEIARTYGFHRGYNMKGGMLAWRTASHDSQGSQEIKMRNSRGLP